jgi:hypothetical protein
MKIFKEQTLKCLFKAAEEKESSRTGRQRSLVTKKKNR